MSNSTYYSDIKFGIHNNAERYTWAAYQLFVLLSSLIGDTLILAASFHEDAFKVNKLIVTVIQHIAVSDLANSISLVLPVAISSLANSWVLGQTVCNVQSYVAYYVTAVGMSLIAVLTTFKYLILRYPLRATIWSKNRAHQVCSFAWAFCVILPILMIAAAEDNAPFNFIVYNCTYDFSNDFWTVVLPTLASIFILAPNLVVISTTVPTLKYLRAARKSARRSHGRVPWKGAITVTLTAFIYIISTFPLAIHMILRKFIDVQDHPSDWFHVKLLRICTALVMINIMANFYIYTLTIRSFRRFLLSKVQLIAPVSLLSTVNNVDLQVTGKDLHRHLN